MLDGLHLPTDDAHDQRGKAGRIEGVAKGAKLVDEAAEGPHVRLVVVLLPLAQLWRQVVRSSDCTLSIRRAGVQHFGETEVPELDLLLLRSS